MPRPDRASATARTRHDGDPRRSTRGCASTRRMRGPRPPAPTSGSPPATRPPLCGIPIGLKDLYAVAGKPLTASSRVLDEVPERDCDVWARLSAEGMVLLGHLHTHEFAAGGTTDQVGNPWALESFGGRIERRLGGRPRRADGAGGDGHRHRRLAANTLGDVRDVGDQADPWPCPDARHRAARARRSTTPGRWRERVARLRAAARRDGAGVTHPPSAGRCAAWRCRRRIADLDPDVADGFERGARGARREAASKRRRRRCALDLGAEFLDLVLRGDARVPPPLRRLREPLPAVAPRTSSSTASSAR